jgi:hypothetical protein
LKRSHKSQLFRLRDSRECDNEEEIVVLCVVATNIVALNHPHGSEVPTSLRAKVSGESGVAHDRENNNDSKRQYL